MAEQLINKQQLAERLNLQVRGVENLMRARKIPFMRVSNKIVRFSWPRVEAALAGYEVKAIVVKANPAAARRSEKGTL
jgi:hypothetical protein